MKVRCVLDAQAGLAEGPHWWIEKSVLIWVDIEASRVGFFDPVTGRNRFLVVQSHIEAVVPMSDGELLAATAQGFVRLHSDSGVVSSLQDPEDDQPGNPVQRWQVRSLGTVLGGNDGLRLQPWRGITLAAESRFQLQFAMATAHDFERFGLEP